MRTAVADRWRFDRKVVWWFFKVEGELTPWH